MQEENIERVPFITLDIKTSRDEYNKLQIDYWSIDDIDTLYVLNSKNRSHYSGRVKHGLDFDSTKWIPKQKDKIYFMKGCTVPRVKLKDLSVKYKIRTTTDIDKATVVVGSNQAGEKLFKESWRYTINGKNFEALVDSLNEIDEQDNYYLNQLNNLKESFGGEWPEVIYTDWNTQSAGNATRDNHTQQLSNKILEKLGCNKDQYKAQYYLGGSEWTQTISEDNLKLYKEFKTHTIIEQSALLAVVNGSEATTIDLDTYQNLRNMFNSSDTDNHVMAMEIMANCNYEDSMLFLNMLFFHHEYQISCVPSRNHVNFKSLKNYMGIGSSYHQHVDTVIKNLIRFNCLTKKALDFILEDQKEYFERNGHSNYIVPQTYVLKRDAAESVNLNYKVEIFEYTEDLPTEDTIPEEEVVEDTVEEVTVSKPDTANPGTQPDPEIEEPDVETEEEVTEEVLIAEKEEVKNEEEFDWF